MRIFVSAQLDDRAAVEEFQDRCRSLGHSVTQDWLNDGEVIPPGFAKSAESAGRVARDDIVGVLDADVFVILTSNEKPGKGMCVELGAALARAELGSLRYVFAVGSMNHETIFYWHPLVTRFENLEQCVTYMQSASLERSR